MSRTLMIVERRSGTSQWSSGTKCFRQARWKTAAVLIVLWFFFPITLHLFLIGLTSCFSLFSSSSEALGVACNKGESVRVSGEGPALIFRGGDGGWRWWIAFISPSISDSINHACMATVSGGGDGGLQLG